jgi:hypothetical protein
LGSFLLHQIGVTFFTVVRDAACARWVYDDAYGVLACIVAGSACHLLHTGYLLSLLLEDEGEMFF